MTWPGGRKATIEKGVVTPIADDAHGACDFWVCPRLDQDVVYEPYEVSACSECGASIAFRASPNAWKSVTPTARKICRPCMLAISQR